MIDLTAVFRNFGRVMAAAMLLLSAWVSVASAQTPDSIDVAADAAYPRVWLVTIEPGEVYWQRFGHNTILIQDTPDARAVSYNFGYFDFEQQDFFVRFLRGRMVYQAIALDADRDLRGYIEEGRRVWLQRLRLSAEQKARLSSHLQTHVQPQNREYRYDYFSSNCSTKLRDALDIALDGSFKRNTEFRSHGWTHRRFARAYSRSLPWLYLSIDLGLGQPVDRPLSLWEEAFIPGELKRRLRDEKTADGLPLVIEEQMLPTGSSATEIWPEPPDWRPLFAAAGVLLAGLLLSLSSQSTRHPIARVFAGGLGALVSMGLGLSGLLLTGLWLGTDHMSAWRNENLLLFLPLWLLTLPAWWQFTRGRHSHGIWRLARAVAALALAAASFALGAKALRGFDQANIEWILMLLPVITALWLSLRRTGVMHAANR